jgi:putative transposase
VNDFKLARETIESIPVKRPRPTAKQPQGLGLDKGFDYSEAHNLVVAQFRFTGHIRSRGEEAKALKKSVQHFEHGAGWSNALTVG